MYSKLDSTTRVNNITKRAAVILSFHSLLRKSKLVQSTYKDVGAVVQRSDVIFTSKGLILNVRKTKTIQCKDHVLGVPVFYVNTPGFCAASMLYTHDSYLTI